MKFCLYEILNAMAEFQEETSNSIESDSLADFLGEHFGVDVVDEGFLEATFVTFVNTYCG